MTICLECGAHRSQRVTRGALMVQVDPDAAYWHGKRFQLSPAQTRILNLLCTRSEVSKMAVALVGSGPDAGPFVVATQISLMRPKLPGGVQIVSTDFGYKLIIEGKDMADVKTRAADHLTGLPDDTTAVVILSKAKNGDLAIFGTVPVLGIMHMLGQGVSVSAAEAAKP